MATRKTNRKRIRKNRYRRRQGSGPLARLWARLIWGLRISTGLAFVCLLSLMFILGHDYMTQCDFFKAQSIRVTGNERLSQAEILNTAGVAEGMNILAVNLSVVRKRLLNHPWIEAARASREIPDGLVLQVREQRPLAILNLDQPFLLNAKGRLFKQWLPGDPDDLTTVGGLKYSDVPFQDEPVKTRIGAAEPGHPFGAVMEILRICRKQNGRLTGLPLRHIEVDREIGLTLHLGDPGKVIKIGYDDYPRKLQRLQRVSAHLNSGQPFKDYRSIDLNSPRRIVVNPIRPSSEGDQKEV